jgi:hypothetical protein
LATSLKAGGRGRVIDTCDPSITYHEVREKTPALRGKGNYERLPHLWHPPDKIENPRVWDDAGAPENDRLGGTIDQINTQPVANPQENILAPEIKPRNRGGRRSRDKGNRNERAIVLVPQKRGFAAERVSLSGAACGHVGGDVSIPLLGVDQRVEVKARGNGFGRLYNWLANHDLLIVRADRREPLVVTLRLGTEIAVAAERGGAMITRAVPDRVAVAATAIIQLIFRSPTPRDLRAQIETLLRDEMHDIRRELTAEIRTQCD